MNTDSMLPQPDAQSAFGAAPISAADAAEVGRAVAEDRRRSARVKKKFISQMTPWAAGLASAPFEVIIEDVSDVGAGIIHDRALEIGIRHLLTVPREDGKAITREYIITRCVPRGTEGRYTIGLALVGGAGAAEEVHPLQKKRITSKQLKLLFLLFGIFGLIIATFAPL